MKKSAIRICVLLSLMVGQGALADSKTEFLTQLKALQGKTFSCVVPMTGVHVSFPYSTFTFINESASDSHTLLFSFRSSRNAPESTEYYSFYTDSNHEVEMRNDTSHSITYFFHGWHQTDSMYLTLDAKSSHAAVRFSGVGFDCQH
jgi:hypothetical protein